MKDRRVILEQEIETIERQLRESEARREGLTKERDDLQAKVVKHFASADHERVLGWHTLGQKIADSLHENEIEARKLSRALSLRRAKLEDQAKKAARATR